MTYHRCGFFCVGLFGHFYIPANIVSILIHNKCLNTTVLNTILEIPFVVRQGLSAPYALIGFVSKCLRCISSGT